MAKLPNASSNAEGGTEPFEAFFRREHPRAVRLAWFLTRSESTAEEIVQEAMAATFERFEDLQTPAAFLTRVVTNGCRSWQRQEVSRRKTLSNLHGSPLSAELTGDIEMLDAVARLPYRQQVVIIARYWGGWSEKEIAEALDCRPGTVKSLASRALDQLRKDLEK